jgi:sulfoxide reductase heme-binding subunit YedZ
VTSFQQHAWWLASRASGVVALLLVSASVLLGLTMASGLLRKPGLKRTVLPFHEHTALAGLVAIAVHGLTLLGDGWLRPGLAGIAVPFVIGYRTVYVAVGILGGYLAALLGLSFYARRRIGGRLWRKLHRATVVVYVLGLVHALGAGTDAGSTWLRALMLATLVPAVGLLAVRVARRRRAPRPAPRGDDAPRPLPGRSAGSRGRRPLPEATRP